MSLVVNSVPDAAANTAFLTSAFAANQTVHVTTPGDYHFNGTAETPFTAGARIECDAGFSYTLGGNAQFTSNVIRFIQHATAPFIRVNGTGFIWNGGVELVGDSTSSAIEISGWHFMATGRHRFQDICFTNWARCFDALAGYYDAGTNTFHADESHADNCRVVNCESFDCPTFFRSLNQQAVNWKFDQCIVNGLILDGPQIVADIQRGGCVTFTNLGIEHPKTTIFKIKDFSPNNCHLACHDLYVDRFDSAGAYLRLVDGTSADVSGAWFIEVDGFAATYLVSGDFTANLFYNSGDLTQTGWDVSGLKGLPIVMQSRGFQGPGLGVGVGL